jgi:nicotinate dehydrogenase subunit A
LQLFDFIEADFGIFIVFEFFLTTCVSVVNISSQETQKNPIKKEPNMARISLRVNGKSHSVETDPETTLLYVLRDDLKLNGPKFGCGLGQCGSCTVIINGNAVRSCQVPVKDLGNRAVTTLEGLGTTKKMHKIQQAFVDEQAVQCGYCINGMIMTTKALLDKNPKPTDAQIKEALAGNLCRCGTHIRILRAVKRASGQKV